MDAHAHRHIVARFGAAQRQHRSAIEDVARFVARADANPPTASDWINLAQATAQGVRAAALIEAYTATLDADQ